MSLVCENVTFSYAVVKTTRYLEYSLDIKLQEAERQIQMVFFFC